MEKVVWSGLAFEILFKLRQEVFHLKKITSVTQLFFSPFQVYQNAEIAGLCNRLPVSKESERVNRVKSLQVPAMFRQGEVLPTHSGFGFIF